MKKSYLFLFLLGLLPLLSLSAQNTLATHFPQTWWDGLGDASFLSADLRISPKGLYVDVELEMEVRCGHLEYGDLDSLESVWHFELPTDATITDSYLWIDGVKVPAGIYERDAGTLIYEEIVNRRQDPSLLLKMRDGHYQLRIYPIPNFTSRRFQLNYRVPIRWNAGQAYYHLPISALQASGQGSYINFPVTIQVGEHSLLSSMSCNNPSLTWTTGANNEQVCETTSDALLKTDYLQWEGNLGPDNTWLALDTNTHAYQLLYQPPATWQSNREPVDLLLVYAFEETASELTLAEMKAMFSRNLASNWQEGDRLIVFRPGGLAEGERYTSLASALEGIEAFTSYSNIPTPALLTSAQNYFSDRAHPILLLTSNPLGFSRRNTILQDLRQPLYVGDLSSPIPTIEYHLNRFQYLNYWNDIARQSGGGYIRLGGAADRMQQLFHQSIPASSTRVYYAGLAPENGFAYEQYWVGNDAAHSPTSPWVQCGRYAGEGDFQFQAHLLQDGTPILANVPLEANLYEDESTERAWKTAHLLAKERAATSTGEQQDVIDMSLSERLLTVYTVFLALDPAIVADQECVGCEVDFDQWAVVDTEEPVEATSWEVLTYPNPFQQELRLRWLSESSSQELSCDLVDMQGRIILSQDLSGPFRSGMEIALWDAKTLEILAPGVYFLRLQDGEKVQSWRVVKAAR